MTPNNSNGKRPATEEPPVFTSATQSTPGGGGISRTRKRRANRKAAKARANDLGSDNGLEQAASQFEQPHAGPSNQPARGENWEKNVRARQKKQGKKRNRQQLEAEVATRKVPRVYSFMSPTDDPQADDELIRSQCQSRLMFRERYSPKDFDMEASVTEIVKEVLQTHATSGTLTRESTVLFPKGLNMETTAQSVSHFASLTRATSDVMAVVDGMEEFGNKVADVSMALFAAAPHLRAVVFHPKQVDKSFLHAESQQIKTALDTCGISYRTSQEWKDNRPLKDSDNARQQRTEKLPLAVLGPFQPSSIRAAPDALRCPASSLGMQISHPEKLEAIRQASAFAIPSHFCLDLENAVQAAEDVLRGSRRVTVADETLRQLKDNLPTHATNQETQKHELRYGESKKRLLNSIPRGLSDIDEQRVGFSRWALCASTGMLTGQHFDGGGSFSWIRILTGDKLWIVYEPSSLVEDQGLDKIAQVVLRPSSVIVMRPTTIHCVYTINNSICHGGHFYMLRLLRETIQARILETDMTTRYKTNACLAYGHAAMVFFGLQLVSPTFRPDADLIEYYDDLKHRLEKLFRGSIFEALLGTTRGTEKERLVKVLVQVFWLTGYFLDKVSPPKTVAASVEKRPSQSAARQRGTAKAKAKA